MRSYFGRRVTVARGVYLLLAAATLLTVSPAHLLAQDLEPRAFSPVPVSVNFAGFGYGYSFGNVLLDPAVPLEDGTGKVHSLLGAYVRTFSLFGMSAKADAVVPFAVGDWEGRLAGQDTSRSASGMGDPAVRLSVNFVGAPALEMPRFMTYRQGTVVGASLRVIAPLGQYDESKLINLGTNRWTFVPRVGVSQRLGRWNLEGVTAAWFFLPVRRRCVDLGQRRVGIGRTSHGGRCSRQREAGKHAIRGHRHLPAHAAGLAQAGLDRRRVHATRGRLRQLHPGVPVPVGWGPLSRAARQAQNPIPVAARLRFRSSVQIPMPPSRAEANR